MFLERNLQVVPHVRNAMEEMKMRVWKEATVPLLDTFHMKPLSSLLFSFLSSLLVFCDYRNRGCRLWTFRIIVCLVESVSHNRRKENKRKERRASHPFWRISLLFPVCVSCNPIKWYLTSEISTHWWFFNCFSACNNFSTITPNVLFPDRSGVLSEEKSTCIVTKVHQLRYFVTMRENVSMMMSKEG